MGQRFTTTTQAPRVAEGATLYIGRAACLTREAWEEATADAGESLAAELGMRGWELGAERAGFSL